MFATSTRLSFSAVCALIVTLALFYLMKLLIETEEVSLTEPYGYIVDFVRANEWEDPKTTRQKPKPVEQPEVPPPAPEQVVTFEDSIILIGEVLTAPRDAPKQLEFGLADGAQLPIVKVQPVYPRRAIEQRIEGFTIVEFDVGPNGAVLNPRIVDHDPGPIFDAASLKAVVKFRYKPMIENGVAVTVTGVQNLFTFELSD